MLGAGMAVGLGVLVAGGHHHFHFQSTCHDLIPFGVRALRYKAEAVHSTSQMRKLRLCPGLTAFHCVQMARNISWWGRLDEIWFLPSLPGCRFSLSSKLKCFIALSQRQSRQVNETLTPKPLHWRRRYIFLILFYAYGCLNLHACPCTVGMQCPWRSGVGSVTPRLWYECACLQESCWTESPNSHVRLLKLLG